MAGAVATVWIIVTALPAGWPQLSEFGHTTGRWQFFDFDPSLTKPSVTFWSGLFGGAFLSLATHGVDQMIVQRYLCARDQKSASWALGLSGFVVFGQFALFLLIGVALACFYSLPGAGTVPTNGDKSFMTFVVDHMGMGFRGLILAAVLAATMSNLSASFNSSASSLMSDWLNRWLPHQDDRSTLRMARLLTLASAVVHAIVAIAVYEIGLNKTVVDAVLSIAGFAIGLLLGLYALGIISQRVSERSALMAFVVGLIVTCYVAFWTPISGYWYTLVGSSVIVIVGLVLSMIFDPPPAKASKV